MAGKTYEGLLFEKKGHIALMTLNRPDKLNALNVPMRVGLGELCQEVQQDPGIRVLVITGAGRAFCAGADLSAPVLEHKADPADPAGFWAPPLLKLEKPTIAAVNGVAAGGGLSVALCCDIRIASDQARFTAVWTRRGLIPDGLATWLLPRIVGMSHACELSYTGRVIDAAEAARIGLVSRIAPQARLLPEVLALADEVAQQAPIALRLTKRAFFFSAFNSPDEQIFHESASQSICMATEDHAEGRKAFLEKRVPTFRGR
ncbi:MAG: enoyl-CoA hydratase/isomerase family protein [Chloroflexi bacterium]|nr:enoyl-CoA hydratase/isomerase family protein [Chloroflexota bacterium]